MSFFQRNSPRPFQRVVYWRSLSGVASVFNKVADGNTTRFIGEFDFRSRDLNFRFFMFSLKILILFLPQSRAPHSPFPSSFGNWPTKWTCWPRVGAKGPWRIHRSVWNATQLISVLGWGRDKKAICYWFYSIGWFWLDLIYTDVIVVKQLFRTLVCHECKDKSSLAVAEVFLGLAITFRSFRF